VGHPTFREEKPRSALHRLKTKEMLTLHLQGSMMAPAGFLGFCFIIVMPFVADCLLFVLFWQGGGVKSQGYGCQFLPFC
jgi:hypothetical protein